MIAALKDHRCVNCGQPGSAPGECARPLTLAERTLLAERGEGLCDDFVCFARFRSIASQGGRFVSPAEAEAEALAIRKEWFPNATLEEPMERRELWEKYHSNECDRTRNDLVEAYLPFVRGVAKKIHSSLPDEAGIELEDLVSVGVFGVIDAIKRFNLAKGIKFETFALQRVRGQIYDELRKSDPAGRLRRQQIKQLEEAEVELQHELRRSPCDQEVAVRLGVEPTEILRRRELQWRLKTEHLDQDKRRGEKQRETERIDPPCRKATPRMRAEQIESLRRVTRGLDQTQRLVVIGYYYLGQTMKEIGRGLNLSESRVSQIHTDVIDRLRSSGRFEQLPQRASPAPELKTPPSDEPALERGGEPSGVNHQECVMEVERNGHAADLTAALSFLAGAGEEDLERIADRSAALEAELESLRLIAEAIRRRLGFSGEPAAAAEPAVRRGRKPKAHKRKPGWLADAMEEELQEGGKTSIDALAKTLGTIPKSIRAVATRCKDRFTADADTIAIAK